MRWLGRAPEPSGGVMATPNELTEAVPLFRLDDSSKARLKRIGVIDVGSNSVRLVVFDGMARSPAYFYNEKVLCGLGAGLAETGRLSPAGLGAGAGGAAPLRGARRAHGALRHDRGGDRGGARGRGRAGVLRRGRARDRAAAARRQRLGGGAARRQGGAARLARRRRPGLRHGRRLDGARASRGGRDRAPAAPRSSGRCSSPTSPTRPSARRRSARA